MPIQGDSPLPPNVYVSIHPDFPFQPSFSIASFTGVIDMLDIRDIELNINFRRWHPHTSTQLGLSLPIRTHRWYCIELAFSGGIYRSPGLRTVMVRRFGAIPNLMLLATAVLFHELTHVSERKKRGDAFAIFDNEEKIVVEKEKAFMRALLKGEKPHFLELFPKK